MNRKGHPPTLQVRQFDNTNAARSGVYSPRLLAPRAREVADALLSSPHVRDIDRAGAEEVGSLLATLEAIDSELNERGIVNRRGEPRALLEYKHRLSGRLLRWLREFGATPASRVDWLDRLGDTYDAAASQRSSTEEGLRLLEQAKLRGDLPSAGPEQTS